VLRDALHTCLLRNTEPVQGVTFTGRSMTATPLSPGRLALYFPHICCCINSGQNTFPVSRPFIRARQIGAAQIPFTEVGMFEGRSHV
jgi:hypothetical protein